MPYLLRTLACIWLLLRVMLTESFVGRISFSFRFPQYFTTAIFTGAVQVTICGLWGNCDVLETGAIFKISIYQTWCNVIFLRIIFFKYSILYDGSIFKMYVQDTQSDGDDCLAYQKWSIQFMFKIRISQRIQIYTNLMPSPGRCGEASSHTIPELLELRCVPITNCLKLSSCPHCCTNAEPGIPVAEVSVLMLKWSP